MDWKNVNITSVAWSIVLMIVLFSAMAVLIPEAQDAGDAINSTDNCDYNGTDYVNCTQPPLFGLFSSGGIIFLIVMASLFIVVYKGFMKK